MLAASLFFLGSCRRPAPPPPPAPPGQGELQVWYIDVGQGDSALVRTPGGKAILVDGGRQVAGEKVLALLRQLGVQRLDMVIASHPHEDHIGGLIPVMEVIPTGQVVDSGFRYASPVVAKYLRLIKQKAIPFRVAKPGQVEEIEPGVTLEFLAPPQPYLTDTPSDPNNNSVVCRLTYGAMRFLFTGDMQDAEREWLEEHGAASRLPATVLKVAHHGSHNGTDAAFLQRVKPTYAVISSGGEYGHPHREALAALQEAGVKVLRTDQLGTIRAATDGSGLSIGPVGPVEAAQPAGGAVIGNRESQVYHRPHCGSLPGKEKRVRFASESEAVRQGYRPHRSCVQ